MKKLIILFLILSLCLSSFGFADYFENVEKGTEISLPISVIDEKGQVFSNAYVEIYSYVEDKVIGSFELDKVGRGTFRYVESSDNVKLNTNEDGILNLNYLLVIMKDGKLATQGYTHIIDTTLNEKIASNNKIDIKEPLKIVAESANTKNEGNSFLVYGSQLNGPRGVVDSKELGVKKIKFAQISSANGCVVQAGITKGSKVTLFGSAIISYKSETSSSMSVSSSPRTSSRGELVRYYTYYNMVEEKYRFMHGGQIYEFYRIRPTNWNGGVTSSAIYKSENNVSYTSIINSVTSHYEQGSSVEISNGETYTFGGSWAGNLTGPLSGNSYSIGITVESGSETVLSREHSGGDYAEYGSGTILSERAIVKK